MGVAKQEIDSLINSYVERVGGRLSPSLQKLIHTNSQPSKVTVTVPYWFSVTEHGRGPRKASQSADLYRKIYQWMKKRSMFKSKTEKGMVNEAKSLTWYINKHGTKQFRSKEYRDVYTSETKKLKEQVHNVALAKVRSITSELVRLNK